MRKTLRKVPGCYAFFYKQLFCAINSERIQGVFEERQEGREERF